MAAPADPSAAPVDPVLLPGHQLERALLLFQQSAAPSSDVSAALHALFASLIQGDLGAVLQSPAGKQLVLSPTSTDGAALLETFLGISTELVVQQERQLTAIFVGAAALLAFMQSNWTGPDLPDAIRADIERATGDRKAVVAQLERDGETIYTEVVYPHLLVAAMRIFTSGHHFNRCIVRRRTCPSPRAHSASVTHLVDRPHRALSAAPAERSVGGSADSHP